MFPFWMLKRKKRNQEDDIPASETSSDDIGSSCDAIFESDRSHLLIPSHLGSLDEDEDDWDDDEEFDSAPFVVTDYKVSEYSFGGKDYVKVMFYSGLDEVDDMFSTLQSKSSEFFGNTAVTLVSTIAEDGEVNFIFVKNGKSTRYNNVDVGDMKEVLLGILVDWVTTGVYGRRSILPKVRLDDGFIAQPSFAREENQEAYTYFNRLRKLNEGIHIDDLNEALFESGIQLVRSGDFETYGRQYHSLKKVKVVELGIVSPVNYFDENFEV